MVQYWILQPGKQIKWQVSITSKVQARLEPRLFSNYSPHFFPWIFFLITLNCSKGKHLEWLQQKVDCKFLEAGTVHRTEMWCLMIWHVFVYLFFACTWKIGFTLGFFSKQLERMWWFLTLPPSIGSKERFKETNPKLKSCTVIFMIPTTYAFSPVCAATT